MAFAEGTTVSVEKSRAEIEALLTRYGATRFASGWDATHAQIAFQIGNLAVRFLLPMPDVKDRRFTHVVRRGCSHLRTDLQKRGVIDQEQRRRWRALALVIKAKLEAVSTGITTLEQEFLAHIVTDDGLTVGDHIVPRLKDGPPSARLLLREANQP